MNEVSTSYSAREICLHSYRVALDMLALHKHPAYGPSEASSALGLGPEGYWRWGQAANNYRTIQVKFTRMVYDKENDLVLVNLLEYCRCGPMTQGAERW